KTWAFVKKQYTALLEARSGAAQAAVVAEPAPTPEAKPTTEVQVAEISIRRAKRQDLEAMANLIASATKGALDPDLSQMMESLFTRAYIVAMAGEYVVGVAGWQAENLIAGLQDFYVL